MLVFKTRGPPPGNAGEEPVDQLPVLLSAQLLKSEPHAAFPNLYKRISITKPRKVAMKTRSVWYESDSRLFLLVDPFPDPAKGFFRTKVKYTRKLFGT
jgi:hypothetical protein